MFSQHTKNIHRLATQYGHRLLTSHHRCVVAESCTGGLLAVAITDIPGSSQWFDRGFVTYSLQSKVDILHIPFDFLHREGPVSAATAAAMAEGALSICDADESIAITGWAGPGVDDETQVPGTVWIAWAHKHQKTVLACYHFQGDRRHIRQQAVEEALKKAIDL